MAVLCAVLAFLFSGTVAAQNVTVTIGVGDTVLEVSGLTSPGAFVTISRDGSVIGTPIAASDGTFSQTFSAQEPGIHQISVYAHTTGGENTDTVTINVNIAEHAITAVSVFLPPTLILEDSSLDAGQSLELSGETAPFGTVTIYIDNANYVTATADAGGLWNASVAASSLSGGQHEVFARATNALGGQSYPTSPRYFTVAAEPQEDVPPADAVPAVPQITYPQQGSTVNEADIIIRGTADPNVQIEIWDASRSIGSVWSDSRGRWSFRLRLSPGDYALRARACLNQICSAFSPTLRFTYKPEKPETAPLPQARPLRISSDQYLFITQQHLPITLRALVVDGLLPYEITVHWGDKQSETFKRSSKELQFTHVYKRLGKYTVAIDVKDSQGRTNSAYFTVHVKPWVPASRVFPTILLFLLLILAALIGLYLYGMYQNKNPKRV
jgi:hypothetical protein